MGWLRLYDGLVSDPKVQLLPCEDFKTLINLWCIANQNDNEHGTFPPVSVMQFQLHCSADDVMQTIRHFVDLGFIDSDNNGWFKVHAWEKRQYKSDCSTDRVRKYRNNMKQERNVSCNVSGNVSETDQKTEDRRQKSEVTEDRNQKTEVNPPVVPPRRGDVAASLVSREIEREFKDRFWPAYPNRIGKGAALKAFSKARRKVGLEVLLAGLERYANKTDDRPWCHPSTWLNQERWLDEPAEVVVSRSRTQIAFDNLERKQREQQPFRPGLCPQRGPVSLIEFSAASAGPGGLRRAVDDPPDW